MDGFDHKVSLNDYSSPSQLHNNAKSAAENLLNYFSFHSLAAHQNQPPLLYKRGGNLALQSELTTNDKNKTAPRFPSLFTPWG